MASLALDGVRVVDLTQVMAGPFCTMILGDLGADVVKVEPPGRGDISRRMGGQGMELEGEDNAPFLALNRNKRSVALNLKDEAQLRAFYSLVESADVVVENFRPGVTERLGIDYDRLVEHRPDLIYASISGFGQSGPYARRPGFDLIAQGMSGIMSVTGEPGGKPVKCGVPISDLSAGLYAAVAILAAYVHRQRTGQGQYLDTSLFEAALSLSVWESAELWSTGSVPRPFGSAHRLNAPYQALKTAEGYVIVGAVSRKQWESLCEVVGRPGLADDERFRTNRARMDHLNELVRELEDALASATSEEWVERLVEAGVPAGPIYDYRKVFDDPHTKVREMVLEYTHPVEGAVKTLGFPYKMRATPARIRRPAPLLGEHDEEIFAELGVSPPEPDRADDWEVEGK